MSVTNQRKRKTIQQKNERKKKNHRSFTIIRLLTRILSSAVLSLIIIALGSVLFFKMAKVTSDNMSPILNKNDRILIKKGGEIRRFSIVYFKVPGNEKKKSIGRVVALPNEKISYKENQLWINGSEIPEYFLRGAKERTVTDFSINLGENQYFIINDDRSNTYDSRSFGVVSEKEMIGLFDSRLTTGKHPK